LLKLLKSGEDGLSSMVTVHAVYYQVYFMCTAVFLC